MSILFALAVSAYHYYSEVKQLKLYVARSQIDRAFVPEISPFWGPFINSDGPLLVAYSNPRLQGNLADELKYWIPRSSKANLHPTSVSANHRAIIDSYTGVGEAKGLYFLGNLFWKVGSPFRVERSLLLTWEDLKEQNVVFLGGPVENLPLRRLPQQQDFVYEIGGTKTGAPRLVIRNRNPRNGEHETYGSVIAGSVQSAVTEDYALISMLKGLEPSRQLLILSGITTFGTQACAECVTDNQCLQELIKHMNVSPDPAKPKLPLQFQVLLKIKLNGSVPVQTSYVTHHVLQ